MALTVAQAAIIAENNYEWRKAAVLKSFAMSSPLMRNMVVDTIPGLSYVWTREAGLPEMGFRGINEAFDSSTGQFEELTAVLKEAGGDMDIDVKLIQNAANGQEIKSRHQELKTLKLGQTIAAKLITGDVSTDPKEFNGLQKIFGGVSPTAGPQIVDNGGAGMSVEKLDELIDQVDNNLGQKVLVMKQAMRRKITTYLRGSSSITTSRDEFGSQITSYGSVPILEADENGNVATIGFDEEGGANTTSIYCAALGDMGFKIVQGNGGMRIKELGELQEKPQERTRVDWSVAPVLEHLRGAARLFSIDNLAVVA